jgi:hypothetical protein
MAITPHNFPEGSLWAWPSGRSAAQDPVAQLGAAIALAVGIGCEFP